MDPRDRGGRDALSAAFARTRARTEALAAPLSAEDQQLQAFADASPTKWHRAHTTWFWETFLLAPAGIAPEHPAWGVLFNSYYEAVGPRHLRPERGLLSRPSAAEIGAWRRLVDERVLEHLARVDEAQWEAVRGVVELGIAHEQQHQELLLTDILAAFARNELRPVYTDPIGADAPHPTRSPAASGWIEHAGGIARIGADGAGFAFDNEGPRHEVLLHPFALATRPVTVGEWAAFAADGGYHTPALWLSEGLAWVREHGVEAPAYTRREGEAVVVYGLHGEREAHPDEPVCHLSFYEADALATWLGGRLPPEAEGEVVATEAGAHDGRGEGALHPVPLAGAGVVGLFGSVWQWTRSSYGPYPGFRAPPGAIGEYNGKFMCNQQVLRGSSVLTPPGHARATYRNFWPAPTRFQAAGLRLARDA
ncbi:MAG: ergothioneine biosynthesis protein EgtB [Myxococcota bacterium]